MATNNTDPEKGLVSASARSAIPSWASSAPDNTISNESSRLTPLQLFQLLVGIYTPPFLTRDGVDLARATNTKTTHRRTDNVGLYRRAQEQERASRLAYQSTSFISNLLYMLQILLAATFTALSAYKDSNPVTLTVLGAWNTVVAGCLAWQKGQGVPQRYRKAQDQYQALILEIEMAERSFFDLDTSDQGGVKLDPRAEKVRLQKLFDTARADQQANYPDLYVSTGAVPAKDAKDLTKELEEAKAETAKVQSEMTAKIEALMAKLGSKDGAQADTAVQSAAKS
ncbi:uncharacterized protein HMPREF1541_10242 [Cyphellophora europaea CBS 101466]|uniref:SMODS and SLOG-associating 2TM effector domain-containing protein n=1 Tax=Cyphellophora europaea (strain CBS 101466) TaxID=1220924 RepID=W2S7A7_CYPE1|nr:uncharacterized protein HMPREF1541_10242 [Cyphellophora europaea CBS 101466]ETN44572.1 hypothetical protein HMPREF1541_10242 [Cyphellophora europaea CBS 101466]